MDKKCENCYWSIDAIRRGRFCHYLKEKPEEGVCFTHKFRCCSCNLDTASFCYNGKKYCEVCLMEQFNICTEKITKYSLDGESLDSTEDIYEVIKSLDADIETLR